MVLGGVTVTFLTAPEPGIVSLGEPGRASHNLEILDDETS
jgi:hypothetical protein